MGTREMERHLERLIPMAAGVVDNEGPLLLLLIIVLEKWFYCCLIVFSLGILQRCLYITFVQAFSKVNRSRASKKFVTGCLILWIRVFAPNYAHLGIDVFGLGFVTSFSFIFLVGVFMSSWLGASALGLGERLTKKMPLIRYIYSASKQKSAAISPDQKSKGFKEVAILRHPRKGEYAIGFISEIVLWWDVNTSGNNYSGSTSHSYGRTWKICWATCLMMVCLFDATSDWFALIKSPERRFYLHPDEQNMQMNECFKQNGWSLAEKFRLPNFLSNLGYLVSENHRRL